MIDFKAAAAEILPRARALVPTWLVGGKFAGKEYTCADINGGEGRSFRVNCDTGAWCDFAKPEQKGTDLISLYATIKGFTQFEAAKTLGLGDHKKVNDNVSAVDLSNDDFELQRPSKSEFESSMFRHNRHGIPSEFWVYRDAEGPLFVVARYDVTGQRKQYAPWSWNSLRWQPKAPSKPRPLYGLDRLEGMKDARVMIIEGEKCADAAQTAYFVNRPCISWMNGVAGVDHADWEPLRRRKVTLWPDRDAPGFTAIRRVAEILSGMGCEVVTIDTSEFGTFEGFDLADAEEAQMTPAEIKDYARTHARKFEPVIGAAKADATKPKKPEAAPTLVESKSNRQTNANTAPAPPAINDSDIANGKRLAARHGNDMKFTPERGWHVWSGQQWVTDDKGVRTQELAKDTALSIFDEIRDAPARDTRMQHAKRSQSKKAVEAMIWLARSERGIPMRLTDFDKDIWSLNVANGTIDLHTGTLRPHRREDLISNLVDVNYDPDAECALWDKFLWRILDQNEELYAYMRRFVGYLLSGDVSDQSLHFLYGKGGNGKSVFCEVLLRLLGQYAHAFSPDLILQKRNAGIPNDVARLRGVRVAFMNETSQGSRFDEAKLKDLTGGDTLSARFLHQEFFDFEPTHRLVIRGNYKPAINGTDEGIWRRLRLVPFTVTIPDEEKDGQLKAKLFAELPGILNWAIRGGLEWQASGLNPPAIITEAVKAYREQSDTLGRFIEEGCEVRKLGQVKTSVFFKRYQEFAETAGERWLQLKDLPGEMQRRGFMWKRTKAGGLFEGLELQNQSFDQGFG